jgi:iron complex outermembrane recepter protein
MTRKLSIYGMGIVLGAALPALQAFSATAEAETTLDEIVVTAQKRTESVQDVPVSITVISGEQLARQGVASVADLSRSSASIEFGAPGTSSPGGGGFVRGIGTNSFGFTAQASVGIVLDGVVMGNANILSLFDLERVEVLKGPQGTMFGNSVSAGVINITSKAPDPVAKAFTVSGEYGSDSMGSDYSRYVIRAAANLPLTATSALRIAVHSDQNDGVFHNTFQNEDSRNPDNGVRIRYMSKPSDQLTINLVADYDKLTASNVPVLTYRTAPAGSQLALALADCGVTAGTSNFDTCSDRYNTTRETTRGLSAQFDWSLGDNTLTSISSYRGRSTGSRGDIMAIPLSITSVRFAFPTGCFFANCVPIFAILPGRVSGLQTHDKKQFSEELRIASSQNKHLEWVAGVYYQSYKSDISELGMVIANFGMGTFTGLDGSVAAVKTTDYAGFGNLTYYVNDATRLIFGARYTHSNVKETKTDTTRPPGNRSLSVDASKFSYRLGVQRDFAPQTMGYLTLSTGYKGPQISDSFDTAPCVGNPGAPAGCGSLYGIKPEIPTSVELGIKTSVLDDRLAIDADVFYTKIKDYQGQNCAGNSSGTITCVPTNVSGVITKGVEVDIFGRPIPGLTLNFSGIYNPAEYPKNNPPYLASDGTNLGGTQLTRAAKTKYTLSGEYSIPAGPNYKVIIGADAAYRSEISIYPSAQSRFIVPSGTITNARFGVQSNDNWSLYVFGRNLGSTAFPRDFFPTPFQPGGLWQVFDAASRKLIGLQFDAKF